MSEALLPAVEIAPAGSPRASVLWLHGLGADGHDFEPIVPELGFTPDAGVRFVFPHAPRRPVTINGGMVMRAWYDIKTLDLERSVDEEEIDVSRRQLEAWIEHEKEAGVPAERIVVAGFSQGGAIALVTGLEHEARLAGILALSCYHPLPHRIAPSEESRRPPIFMAHGTQDPVVPIALAEMTLARLREQGHDPEWHRYPMPHSVSAEEVRDVARWLRRVLA